MRNKSKISEKIEYERMGDRELLDNVAVRQEELLSLGSADKPYYGLGQIADGYESNDYTLKRTESAELIVKSEEKKVKEPPSKFNERDLPSYELPSVECDLDPGETTQKIYIRDHEEVDPCNSCSGTGTTSCLRCNGTGKHSCGRCSGTGTDNTCRSCQGRGKERRRCNACGGSGELEREEQCRNCGGTDEVYDRGRTTSCPECDGGVVTMPQECTRCGGGGRVREVCTSCGGDGENPNSCVKCSASGDVDCDACDARGHVDCANCEGELRYEKYTRVERTYKHTWDVSHEPGELNGDEVASVFELVHVSDKPIDAGAGLDIEYEQTETEEMSRSMTPEELGGELSEKRKVTLSERTQTGEIPVRSIRYQLGGIGRLLREGRVGTDYYRAFQIGDQVRFETAPTRLSVSQAISAGKSGFDTRLLTSSNSKSKDNWKNPFVIENRILSNPIAPVVLIAVYVVLLSGGSNNLSSALVSAVAAGGVALVSTIANPLKTAFVSVLVSILYLIGLAIGGSSYDGNKLLGLFVLVAPAVLGVLLAVLINRFEDSATRGNLVDIRHLNGVISKFLYD